MYVYKEFEFITGYCKYQNTTFDDIKIMTFGSINSWCFKIKYSYAYDHFLQFQHSAFFFREQANAL